MIAALRADGTEVLDLLDVLRQASTQPYWEDIDGHPNAAGKRLIAWAVATHLSTGFR